MRLNFSMRIATAAALAFAIQPVAAQEGGEVALRFLSFPRTLDPEPVELVVGEGRTVEVKAPSNEFSETVRVPRMASWVIGRTTLDEERNPGFTVFGKGKALASARQIVLLIRKGKSPEEGVEVIAIDDRAGRFWGGDFLFFNAAKVDIACDVAGEKFAIKPGDHHIMRPEGDGRTAHFTFYFRKADAPRPFFSSRWPIDDEARGLIFFYHDPDSNRLRLHTIRNFIDG